LPRRRVDTPYVPAKASPAFPFYVFGKVRTVAKNQNAEIDLERRAKDRRAKEERRKQEQAVAVERRQGPRREKVARRRQIDPTTCERDYTGEEIEFMQALEAYKVANGRMFPTCSEILEVIRKLGYVRLPEAAMAAAPAADAQGLPAPIAPVAGFQPMA
jgi:hypothetical protein